jgi:phosphohistidine phosphatase
MRKPARQDGKKRLLLLRHAKSGWDDPSMNDRDRPLTASGRNDAARIAAYMAERSLRPDHALCSPAVRTRETLGALETAIGKIPTSYREELYLAEAARFGAILATAPPAATLLVIGHNPGLGAFASQFTDLDNLETAFALSTFPTAALAVLEGEGQDWAATLGRGLTLTSFITPDTLP